MTSRIERKGLDLELVSNVAPASSDAPRDDSPSRADGSPHVPSTAAATAAVGTARPAALSEVLADVLADARLDTMLEGTAAPTETETEAETKARLESQALRAELTQIAVVLDLPEKRIQRPTAADNVAIRQARQFSLNASQWIAGAIVFAGAGIAAFLLRAAPVPVLPPALLGEWTTRNPAYQGRQLAFVESQIVLRVSPDAPLTRHPIVGMTTKTVADTTVLGLTYATQDGEMELHARLVGRERPVLIFDRPSDLVWERRND